MNDSVGIIGTDEQVRVGILIQVKTAGDWEAKSSNVWPDVLGIDDLKRKE